MDICIDFDGTIVDHRYPEIGEPVPYALEFMKEWLSKGGKLILFTMRDGFHLDDAQFYLERNGIELYGINRNPDQDAWTQSPKAYGQVYIDDSAFGCPLIRSAKFNRPVVDWSVVGPEVSRMLDERAQANG